jgi:hypothetical protein
LLKVALNTITLIPNTLSPMFVFNCPNFDLWYLHFYKNGHVSL